MSSTSRAVLHKSTEKTKEAAYKLLHATLVAAAAAGGGAAVAATIYQSHYLGIKLFSLSLGISTYSVVFPLPYI